MAADLGYSETQIKRARLRPRVCLEAVSSPSKALGLAMFLRWVVAWAYLGSKLPKTARITSLSRTLVMQGVCSGD